LQSGRVPQPGHEAFAHFILVFDNGDFDAHPTIIFQQ
jgi:hypothetical protein